MRDHYAGDISDFLKFAFLRAIAGSDRKLGIAWYYATGVDRHPDGRHLEWRHEPKWKRLDAELHSKLSILPERSVAALEALSIWPEGVVFHRDPIPVKGNRLAWATQKRNKLDSADLVFLDPDNGLGKSTIKHATHIEVERLARPGRSIAFITFPGRNKTHEELIQLLHSRLKNEAGAKTAVTLRTSVSVPSATKLNLFVPRTRWFTVINPSTQTIERVKAFSEILGSIPRTRAHINFAP